MKPGVQKPHWYPASSRNAFWIAVPERPSMVVIAMPSASTASSTGRGRRRLGGGGERGRAYWGEGGKGSGGGKGVTAAEEEAGRARV